LIDGLNERQENGQGHECVILRPHGSSKLLSMSVLTEVEQISEYFLNITKT